MSREQAKAMRKHNDHLEDSRDKNHLERQHRMHEASQLKMMQVKKQRTDLNRDEEVRIQTRNATMHSFSLQRLSAYDVYMEKKRAREKLQNDEAAYDWLDLGPVEKVDWVANMSFEISKFKFNISDSLNLRTSQGSFSAVSKPNFATK